MLLFVYGTMLSLARNHGRLYEQRAIMIGKFQTQNIFEMYLRTKNGAPCAVPNHNGFPIAGELYALSDEAVYVIDRFEGHPIVYERKPVVLQGFRGAVVEMYHYVRLLDSDEKPIAPDADRVLRYKP